MTADGFFLGDFREGIDVRFCSGDDVPLYRTPAIPPSEYVTPDAVLCVNGFLPCAGDADLLTDRGECAGCTESGKTDPGELTP